MEQCEQYKSLQPQFTLHIGELVEWLREQLQHRKATGARNTSTDNVSSQS